MGRAVEWESQGVWSLAGLALDSFLEGVSVGKLLSISVPQRSHLQNRNDFCYLTGFL